MILIIFSIDLRRHTRLHPKEKREIKECLCNKTNKQGKKKKKKKTSHWGTVILTPYGYA